MAADKVVQVATILRVPASYAAETDDQTRVLAGAVGLLAAAMFTILTQPGVETAQMAWSLLSISNKICSTK
jgi:hypothetical protein